jgi:predicted PurR-regulated permease PerM
MTNSNSLLSTENFPSAAIETAIKLGLLFLLASVCLDILHPFLMVVFWGVIIAVAAYPLYLMLKKKLGGKVKLAAIIYTLLALSILTIPSIIIADSIIFIAADVKERVESDEMHIPAPGDNVKDWPIVGEKIYNVWSMAHADLEKTLKHFEPQIKEIANKGLKTVAGLGATILQFALSIIISGVLVTQAEASYKLSKTIFRRLAGEGVHYTETTIGTIRSVAQGVLGIALFQATLAGLGMWVMDVPGWGFWTFLVLVVAVVQLPPLLILGPVAAYVFTVADTTPAIIFLIYSMAVSFADGVLKPLVLGRGVSTPMLVILLGAIGGMITSGIIGLFTGAVILALGYELLVTWIYKDEPATEPAT